MRKDLRRVLLHIPLGLVTCFLFHINWALGLAFTVSFLAYEHNEDLHTKDQMWKDLKGYLWGLALGGLGLFIFRMLS